MGGVAGHMDHLYDNHDLTFRKMKEIMTAASNAELDVEEKTDGQNIFLSYSIPEGKAKGARNKGNLKSGGLDATGLAQKFAGRGNIEKSFTEGFKAFEDAVEGLSFEEKKRVFGPDTNIWYNAEIMDPGSKNVILYDGKTLKIHDVGHFVFDRESGEKDVIPEDSLGTLDNALQRMQKRLENNEYSLARRAVIQLRKLDSDQPLRMASSKLDKALSEEGLSDKSTVQDYVISRLMNGIDTKLPNMIKQEIVKYIMKLEGNIGLRELKKKVPPSDLEDLNNIINSKQMLLKEAILPIEMIIHDFTVEILKGLESSFILDTGKEVERLRNELSKQVNRIIELAPDNPKAMEVMQKELNKIKDMGNITTPVEGIVFDYDGHTYKFAGNYAPLNQILGMFRYEKGDKKLASESMVRDASVISENEGKRIALVPGGFKPPHAGHFMLAKHFANKKNIDEVIVIVSTKPRPPVNVDMAVKLWELYTKDFPKIKVRAGTTPSPVGDVYELIADNSVFKSGDVALLGKSEKDADDARFDRAQSYAERNNPGVKVEPVVTPLFAGGVSGTHMRNLLVSGDEGKVEFKSNLPNHLSAEEKELAYSILTNQQEFIDRMIDDTIEEMSTMAAGAIEGAPGGFGSGRPNTFNPYKRRTKKPKVKRAKRQRRR
jgi:hypothetical protein